MSVIIEAMSVERNLSGRVQRLQAIAESSRLAIVDTLDEGDVSPGELAAGLNLPANLLAHHLNVLERAGVVRRKRSEADRRRSYVALVPGSLDGLLPSEAAGHASRVVFVCTRNSARSQLAAALWKRTSPVPATSGGTDPASEVHPRAVSVARRHGVRIGAARPRHVAQVLQPDDLVVTVCDGAHEQLESTGRPHVHWSVSDPVRVGTDEAFENAFDTVASRVVRLAEMVTYDGGSP